ncbi:MAG: hypothetical protein ACXAD7_10795 [Candidatus Kariarchaeaceae archaeon]
MPLSNLFGKLPDRNHLYCVQDKSINAYKILSHDKSEELFHILAKTATTKAKYRVRKVKGSIAVGSIIQGVTHSDYKMLDNKDEELAKVRISDKEIEILVGNNKYTCSDFGRAKRIDFLDTEKKYALVVDKKILSMRDEYHIVFVEGFAEIVAVMMPVVIDDYFHRGLN